MEEHYAIKLLRQIEEQKEEIKELKKEKEDILDFMEE